MDTVLLDFAVKPRLHYSLALFVPFLLGLLYCIHLLPSVLNDFDDGDVVTFTMCVLLSMLCHWWRTHKVEPWLGRVEHSFWSMVERSCDCRHLSYCSGSTYGPTQNLTVELVLAVCLILLCSRLMGIAGGGISFLVSVLVISRYVVGILQDRSPYNQWHLCLMDNVTSWTLLMLTLTGVFVVLFAMEVLLPQRLHLAETPPSVRQAFVNPHFREITPSTASALEANCIECLFTLAERDFSRPDGLRDTIDPTLSTKIQGQMVIDGWIFLVILWIPVYFFSVRPFRAILHKQNRWAVESSTSRGFDGPSPLYLPQAWARKSALGVRYMIILHYIAGAMVNITAAILCVDCLGYAFCGRAFLFANTGNLCSWLFASSKIALGPKLGQIAAVLTSVALTLPLLVLTGAFIRRALLVLFLWFTILTHGRASRSHPKTSRLQEYLTCICREHGIKVPVLLLTRKTGTRIQLRHVAVANTAVIELSADALEILSDQELTAVISHEVAHIRQGLWPTTVLRAMSCLAMFPNYYLTLCLDWADKEMDADRFAVAVTGDADALIRALVKVSASQLTYVTGSDVVKEGVWTRPLSMLRIRWNSLQASLRFFFGDGLLGYTHPYLSDRLEAIGHG
jgi:Zn-dependent protease with chaperone function